MSKVILGNIMQYNVTLTLQIFQVWQSITCTSSSKHYRSGNDLVNKRQKLAYAFIMYIDWFMPWTCTRKSQPDYHCRLRSFLYGRCCRYRRRHQKLRIVLTRWSWILSEHYHLRNSNLYHTQNDPQSHPTWHYQNFNKSKSIWVAKISPHYSNVIWKILPHNKIRWRRTRRSKKNEFLFNHV